MFIHYISDELCHTTGNPSDYSKTLHPCNPSCVEQRGAIPTADIGFSAVSSMFGTGISIYQTGPRVGGSLGTIPPQVGPVPGHKMSQVLAPTPASRGFMPVTSARVQRPGMGPTQPRIPTQPAQVRPAITPAQPHLQYRQLILQMYLLMFLNETSEALGGSLVNPAKKREIEDNSRKIGASFAKLDISKNASEKLVQLCQSLDNGDFGTALQIQVQLTTSDWDECNFWLATLKRMIKTWQSVR
ncbi:hypothetical protein RHSIM_Rhsim07G0127800 [Rhododendron simsii]|uniref:SRA1/Sec31 domain-containing protein n=1 Tax=Rhododendron simsii TaxID=118357 RepID=A0A834GQA6_RHOSS|nr:hypothetical protein RHSIM_Rhsim07G0127800 [Rhododendron simsii]